MTISLPAAISLCFVALSTLMGAGSLTVGRALGRDREKLQAAFAFSAAFFVLAGFPLSLNTSESALVWGLRFQQVGATAHIVSWIFLSRIVAGERPTRFESFLAVWLLGLGALSLIPSISFSGVSRSWYVAFLDAQYRDVGADPLNQITYVSLFIGMVVTVRNLLQRRRLDRETVYYLVALSCVTVAGTFDGLISVGAISAPYLLPLGLFISALLTWLVVTQLLVRNAKSAAAARSALERTAALRQKALVETRRELDRAADLAGFGLLASGIAWEIQAPTREIITNLEAAISFFESNDLEGLEAPLSAALSELARVDHSVRDLLIAGRVAGRPEKYVDRLDLQGQIERAIQELEPGDLDVRVNVPAGLEVIGHPGVLVPILRNAIFFAAEATQDFVDVSASLRADGAEVVISFDGQPFLPHTTPNRDPQDLRVALSFGLAAALGAELTTPHRNGRETFTLLLPTP